MLTLTKLKYFMSSDLGTYRYHKIELLKTQGDILSMMEPEIVCKD